VLNRESIPMPLIPDIPKQLAIITSAVIRNSRDYHSRAKPNDPSDRPLNEFCSRCFEVEESALQRVSQLATRISTDRRRPDHSPSLSVSNPPSTAAPRRTRKSSGRPSTAPSPSDASPRRLFSEPTTPSSPSQSQANWESRADGTAPRTRKGHMKSSSTDSIPYPKSTSITPMPTPIDHPDSDDKKRKGLLRIWRR